MCTAQTLYCLGFADQRNTSLLYRINIPTMEEIGTTTPEYQSLRDFGIY